MAKSRRIHLNRRLALILIVMTIVSGVGVALAHKIQKALGLERALQTGIDAVETEDWPRAGSHLKHYLQFRPNHLTALEGYGEALLKGYANPNEAYDVHERILKLDEKRHRIRRQQIEIGLALGWIESARKHAEKLLEQFPDNADALYLGGRCEEAAQNFDNALRLYLRAFEQEPLHPGTNRRLAVIQEVWKLAPDQADRSVARLEQSGDTSPETLYTLAEFRLKRHRIDAAHDLVRQAFEDGHGDTKLLVLAMTIATRQANLLANAGDKTAALELLRFWQPHMQTAINASPESVFLDMGLAQLQRSASQHEPALQTLRNTVARVPEHIDVRFQLVWQLLQMNHLDEAESVFAELPETDIGMQYRRTLSGLAALQRGELQTASETLSQCIQEGVEPRTIETSVIMCYVGLCEQQGHWDSAAVACQRVLELTPDNRTARVALALAHLVSGQRKAAFQELRRTGRLGQVLKHSVISEVEPLKYRLPVGQLLASESSVLDTRDQVFLAALVAVSQGDLDEAQQRLAAADSESKPEERLFDLVVLSAAGEPVPVEQLEQVAHLDRTDARPLSALFASWGKGTKRDRIESLTRDRLTGLLVADWQSNADVLAAACSNASRMLQAKHPQSAAGLLQTAETLYAKLVELNPSQIPSFIRFLIAHRRLDDAVKWCQSVWNSQPQAVAPLWLSAVQSQVGNTRGLKQLETQLAATLKQPNDTDSRRESQLRLVLGDIYLLTDRYALAEREYRQVVGADRSNVAGLNNLAWLLTVQNAEIDIAFDLISQAISINGPTANLLDTQGCVQLVRGETQAALVDLQAASERSPGPDVLSHLALAQLQQGDREAALDSLRQAIVHGFDLDQRPLLEYEFVEPLRAIWSEARSTGL